MPIGSTQSPRMVSSPGSSNHATTTSTTTPTRPTSARTPVPAHTALQRLIEEETPAELEQIGRGENVALARINHLKAVNAGHERTIALLVRIFCIIYCRTVCVCVRPRNRRQFPLYLPLHALLRRPHHRCVLPADGQPREPARDAARRQRTRDCNRERVATACEPRGSRINVTQAAMGPVGPSLGRCHPRTASAPAKGRPHSAGQWVIQVKSTLPATRSGGGRLDARETIERARALAGRAATHTRLPARRARK